ncbi:hypothetical protein Sango_1639300 [Sesamum angolense]|uniref:Uncharacterized protein n=1 Tax=Sesamum angolense TaxID=2727404 RepID=A0AAE2BRI1_9LAMI|nr:hypothetical protein Sango_1639300 [Sesamum angolense]
MDLNLRLLNYNNFVVFVFIPISLVSSRQILMVHELGLCCFSKEEITLLPENVSSIPKAFKLLRVLAVTPVVFTRFPLDLIQLIHLKYIALSSTFKVLPEVLAKLWNLQTLIIHTTSRALKVKADIWQMTQLRYLKTNASITLVIETTGKAEASKLKTFIIYHQKVARRTCVPKLAT